MTSCVTQNPFSVSNVYFCLSHLLPYKQYMLKVLQGRKPSHSNSYNFGNNVNTAQVAPLQKSKTHQIFKDFYQLF